MELSVLHDPPVEPSNGLVQGVPNQKLPRHHIVSRMSAVVWSMRSLRRVIASR